MKRYLQALAFALLTLAASTVRAADDNEEFNAFGYPHKTVVKIIDNGFGSSGSAVNSKPECSDPKLAELAQKALQPYIGLNNRTIAEKRRTRLILKNTDNFLPLDPAEILPETHRAVAGRIIELKINRHLNDANIKVCQSDNPVLSAKLYLVLYDDENNVRVEIINFAGNKIPSFIFNAD